MHRNLIVIYIYSPNELFQKPLKMTFAFVVSTFIAELLFGQFRKKTPLISLKRTFDVTIKDTFRMLKVLGKKDCQVLREEYK